MSYENLKESLKQHKTIKVLKTQDEVIIKDRFDRYDIALIHENGYKKLTIYNSIDNFDKDSKKKILSEIMRYIEKK